MFRVNLSSIIFLLGWFFWDPCPGRSLFATKSTSVSEWCPDEWGTVHLYAPKSPWLHFNVLPFHMFVFGKCTSLNLEFPCISDHIYYRWGDYGWQQVLTMIHTYSTTLGEEHLNSLATHSDVSTPKSFGYSRWCFYRCSSISSLLRDLVNLRQQFSENSSGK